MIYLRGHLARPLDAVLGHASRLAVLRALFKASEGLTGRQAAARSEINHQAAALALKALEIAGIVYRREDGRSTLWRLDRRRELVAEVLVPLFEGEGRNADEVVETIKDRLSRKADAVVIVGEAAKGKLRVGEALELAILCEHGRRRALNDELRALTQDLDARFSLSLKVLLLTKREAPSHVELLDGWQLLPTEGRPSVFSV